MSDNDSSIQNSQMSIRELEMEEMAQELMNIEMYEEGMDFDQMKQILRIINESKNMAGIKEETRSSQGEADYQEETRGEILPKKNSLRDTFIDEDSIPKPSFSYRSQSGRTTPPASGRKSASETASIEDMPQRSPDMFDNEDKKRSSAEGESIFDKLVKENEKTIDEKDDTNESRSQTQGKNPWRISPDSTENSQNSESGETTGEQQHVKSRKNQRIERWKLDPTDPVIEDNDVPLRERKRPVLNEKVPYSFCHNEKALDPDIGEKVLTVLTHALDEVAEIWRRKHRPDSSEFQWGSPIKVDSSKRSSDEKMVIGDADISSKGCEIYRTNSDTGRQRNCKRKAAEFIKNQIDNEEIGSDEDDDDNIFEKVKKAKKTDEHWQPKLSRNKSDIARDKSPDYVPNFDEVETATTIADCDSDEFDNYDLSSLRRKNIKKNEEISRSVSPDVFPRRIVPPNPNKPKAPGRQRKNGEKSERKSPVKKNKLAVSDGNKNSLPRGGRRRNPLAKKANSENAPLNDEEITNELDNDESEASDEKVEIKPIPMKGLANKLQLGASKLLEKKREEERLKKAQEQERLDAEMAEQQQRQEIHKAKWLKEREEQRDQEAKESERKAKEEMWKKNQAARDRKRRRQQAEEKKRSGPPQEGLLLMDEDEDEIADSIIENIDAKQRSRQESVQCPICNLEFSKEDIQNHAADCNQFDDIDEPGPSASPNDNDELIITNDQELLQCGICSSFTTTDGIVYEQHTHECNKRRVAGMNSPNRFDPAATEVIEIPTSPIRTFTPLSEQDQPGINYAGQFRKRKIIPNKRNTRKRR